MTERERATTTDEEFMRLAIARALEGVAAGQSPFGAAVVRDGDLLSCEHNVVLATLDPSVHAEIHALRTAARSLRSVDLAGCVVYATSEPCAMCFGACHWAHIERIVFGSTVADTAGLGFGELNLTNQTLRGLAASPVQVVGGVLRDECLAIFEVWRAAGRTTRY